MYAREEAHIQVLFFFCSNINTLKMCGEYIRQLIRTEI